MIIYNVTCNLPHEIELEWLHWMKTVHIPEVIATKKFTDYKILKLLTNVEHNEGVNYAIQYRSPSMNSYNEYAEHYAPALKAKTFAKYGEQVLAFRTLLLEIDD